MLTPSLVTLFAVQLASPTATDVLGACPEPFDARWQCGSLEVPEHRDRAGARMIPIEIMVRRAGGRASGLPIFLFSGGPGAPTATGADPDMMSRQAATNDLVLIDQRGTGRSNGFHCETGLESHADRAFGQLYPLAQIADCRRRVATHADPDRYTTGDFVEDVEAVRALLGYDRIIVTGGSYGTRSALAYLSAYPDRVAGAVLNGVLPPDDVAPLTYARSAQQGLERVFDDCRKQAPCNAAYPDLESHVDELMHRLRDTPALVGVRRPDGVSETVSMSDTDLAYAIRIMLYNRNMIPRVPRLLHGAVTTGNLTPFAQAHYDRAVGVLGFASIGLHFSVFCAEDVPFVTDAAAAPLVRETYFGTYFIDQYREGCRRWPVTRRAPRDPSTVGSDTPVLLMSGRYDPVTPPEFGAAVQRRFPNSFHFVQGNGGHGAGGGCVNDLLSDFYAHLDPARLESMCASVRSATFEVPER